MGLLLFVVYLIEKVEVFVDSLKSLSTFTLILFFIFTMIYVFLWLNDEKRLLERFGAKLKKWSKIALVTGITSGVIATLMPTKNFIYIAVGLKVGQEIIQYKNINTMMDKSIRALELKLDNVIKELDVDNIKNEIEEGVKAKANETVDEIKAQVVQAIQ